MSDSEGSEYTYKQSERLGMRIAALIRNGFHPRDAAQIALLEIGEKFEHPRQPNKSPRRKEGDI